MSVRTLQRRLAEAGLTYSAIVDEIRSVEARRLLAQPGVLLKQVAADLGFCEPASFTRACRRWTGFSPREYRRQLREASRGGRPLPASRLQI
jgi:AraC-like DNA-binding protein